MFGEPSRQVVLHQELLELIPTVESKSVERLKYLVELSLLWDMSVDAVMEKLEIKTPLVIHVYTSSSKSE